MGLLTDAFIATEAEVAAADFADHDPAGLFETVQAKRVDDLKLAHLDAIVTGQPLVTPEQDPEASVRRVEERFVLVRNIGSERGADAEGPWISQFPEPLVARLAALSPAEAVRCGEAWAGTDEWRLDGVSAPEQVADVVRLLQEYCRLATRAQAEGRRMYMWTAL